MDSLPTESPERIPLRPYLPSISSAVTSDKIIPRRVALKERTPRQGKPPDGVPLVTGQLSRKQRLFCQYYLEGNSPRKAALLAGYKEGTAGVAVEAILHHPLVWEYLSEIIDNGLKKYNLSNERIINRVAYLSEANIIDFVDIDETGGYTVNLKNITREMAMAIQELSFDAQGRAKIRLVDRKSYHDLLARLKKMLGNVPDPKSGDGEFTIQNIDAIVKEVTNNNYQINVVQQVRQLPESASIEG